MKRPGCNGWLFLNWLLDNIFKDNSVATLLDLINSATTDATVSAADQAAVVAAQAKYTTDTNTESVDDSALAAALAPAPAGHGPQAVLDTADPPQFVTVYMATSAAPGWTAQQIPFATNVVASPPASFVKK